jgi:hypothetical protein
MAGQRQARQGRVQPLQAACLPGCMDMVCGGQFGGDIVTAQGCFNLRIQRFRLHHGAAF